MTFPYDDPVDAETMDIDPGRLAKVIERFGAQQRSGAFPGGQLVVRRNGKLVLNQAIGIASGFRQSEQRPQVQVQPTTPFPVLSAGKPLAAIVIAMLEDRGQLDVNAPIAHFFPAFAQHGKERITTLDVLTHRSGMLMPDFVKRPDLWGDREAIQRALIETVPSYPRGTLAYHPYEYGWILSEILLQVDGRSLPDFFADEIALPLQLPALRFGSAGRSVDSLAFSYWLGKEKVIVAGINVAEDFEAQNSEQFLDARNPATSLACDAASLAAFYDFLLAGGQTRGGKRLISDEKIRRYTSRHVLSWDRSLGTVMAVGRGFVVGTRFPSTFGWWDTNSCFGHAGGFSSLAFGDYAIALSAAIVTNGNRGPGDFMRRFVPLAHALRKACRR